MLPDARGHSLFVGAFPTACAQCALQIPRSTKNLTSRVSFVEKASSYFARPQWLLAEVELGCAVAAAGAQLPARYVAESVAWPQERVMLLRPPPAACGFTPWRLPGRGYTRRCVPRWFCARGLAQRTDLHRPTYCRQTAAPLRTCRTACNQSCYVPGGQPKVHAVAPQHPPGPVATRFCRPSRPFAALSQRQGRLSAAQLRVRAAPCPARSDEPRAAPDWARRPMPRARDVPGTTPRAGTQS